VLLRGYTTSNQYVWNSTGALSGTENIGVWVRDATSSASYDAFDSMPYIVTQPQCGATTIAGVPSTVVHSSSNGTHVIFTATAPACTTGPRYEFWMRAASQSTWQLIQGYGTSPTYDWNSTGAAVGTVYFGVWVRDSQSTQAYDNVASTPETVT
jgi:hypothetical protein